LGYSSLAGKQGAVGLAPTDSASQSIADPVDHQQGNVGKLPLQTSHEEEVDLVRKKLLTFLILLKLGIYIGFNICKLVSRIRSVSSPAMGIVTFHIWSLPSSLSLSATPFFHM
jgi:hypothetical protein